MPNNAQLPDTTRFALLVNQHQLDLYGWFYRRVRLPEDAEELTCQVFTDLWRKWPEYAQREGWPLLESFARKLLYQHHRSKGRCARLLERAERLLGEPTVRSLFDTALEHSERSSRLYACLKALNPLLRRILELYYWEALSDQEIAGCLEDDAGRPLTQDAVKQRRLRVMPKLQICLEAEGVPHV